MSKQTAVDYITQGLEKLRHKFDQDTILTLQYLIIEAKQMQKKQMYEFWLNGMKCDSGEGSSFDKYMEIKYEGKI